LLLDLLKQHITISAPSYSYLDTTHYESVFQRTDISDTTSQFGVRNIRRNILRATGIEYDSDGQYQYDSVTDDIMTIDEIRSKVYNEMVSRMSSGDADEYIVDVYPLNWLNVGWILTLFPDAVIINLIRNPIDMMLEMMRHSFDPSLGWGWSHSIDDAVRAFGTEYVSLLTYWHSFLRVSSLKSNIIEIVYDDLLENPTSVVHSILDKLGVYEEADSTGYDIIRDASDNILPHLQPGQWKHYSREFRNAQSLLVKFHRNSMKDGDSLLIGLTDRGTVWDFNDESSILEGLTYCEGECAPRGNRKSDKKKKSKKAPRNEGTWVPVTVPPERNLLGTMLDQLDLKVGIEIGVQRGEYAEELLSLWKSCKKYYLIDVWAPQEVYFDGANVNMETQEFYYQDTRNRLAKFEAKKNKNGIVRGTDLIYFRNYSSDAALYIPDLSVDFIYIDARHVSIKLDDYV
jgi:hypothetical protein